MRSFASRQGDPPGEVPIAPRPGAAEAPQAARIAALLDPVDWSAVYHAYGPATDVPAQLWAVAIGDEPTRRAAWVELWVGVLHQGSVYDATAAALPAMVALAEWREHPDRADAIEMVHAACVADDVRVWRWDGDGRIVEDDARGRAVGAELRAAGRAATERLLAGWRREPEAVRRALVLLLAGHADLHDEHRPLLDATLPPEHEAGFRAVLHHETDDEEDAYDAFEQWVHEPRL